MSLEIEDAVGSTMEASESTIESEKKLRVSYTRDFLLSLSELEICKTLPSDFDRSVLSEFEDTSIQERPRNHGSLPLQGFRRNDYSSSPPMRGDSSNFSRGVYGRWDNRSSNWSDKDGDSQSDLDPDSGRRSYGGQSRRPWQNSEHDGLLGSGSFARPSGLAAGTSAPKGHPNEHYHLNRSNEAYQPPRPFKAVAHTRNNTHDSFNDETFGFSESTSQDRAEEERKRRASFEMMRKEQQKVLQEKQKSSADKHKNDAFTELILEETKEEALSEASGELNSTVQSVPSDDPGKSSILLQSSKPRPLVPPGFRSTIMEKSSTTKPISSIDKENPKPGIEEIQLLAKGKHTQNGTLKIAGLSEVHDAAGDEVFDFLTSEFLGNKVPTNSSQESTTSILGKVFGSTPASKDSGATGFPEQQKSKPDDPLSPGNVRSSRFAQWFDEDEKKPTDDLPSTRPNDLLSLIVGGEKTGSQVPKPTSTDPVAPELPYNALRTIITQTPSDSNHLHQNSAPPVSAILTCEDLEQTILSEYTEKSSTLPPPVPDWGQEKSNTDAIPVDNQATNHLLSLLQKGTVNDDIRSSDTISGLSEKPAISGQNLSLEALFGTAFMKELQSAQEPVSAQRGSAGSARIDIFENGPLSSNVDGIGPNMTTYGTDMLATKQKQPLEPESWLNFNGQQVDVDPLRMGVVKPAGSGEIQLPEEESLIMISEPATGKRLPADVAFDISEKLAVLNSGFRGERFGRVPYDMMDPERQVNHLHPQPSPPQIYQMNHNQRPVFQPLDHMNSQMRFPDQLREASRNQHVPANLIRQFHHPDSRVTGFDVPQMFPQMRVPGNFPPHHLLHNLSKPSSLVHPHAANQPSGFMTDREAMHRFPFAHQQANIGGLGMPLPVPDAVSGSNHPEALQRMLEMEARAQAQAQSKQVNAVQSQGMYGGHELDMGFRYR